MVDPSIPPPSVVPLDGQVTNDLSSLLEMVELVPEPFLLFDADLRLLVANAQARELLPKTIAPQAELAETLSLDRDDPVIAALARLDEETTWRVTLLESRHRPVCTIVARRRDGRLALSLRPDLDSAAHAIRTSEEKFSTAFYVSPDVLVISRAADGRILSVNDRFEELFGIERAEAIGKTPGELGMYVNPERDRPRLLQLLDGASGLRAVEVAMRRRDGEEIVGSVSTERMQMHGQECYLTIVRDVTGRVRMEEELRSSRRQLELAIEAGHLGICEWNLGDNSIEWSREHFELLGYEPFSFRPTFQHWLDRIHPEDLERVRAHLDEALHTLTPVMVEYRTIHPDGTQHWLQARGRYNVDESGKAYSLSGLLMDVSEMKRFEEELRQSEELFSKAFYNSPDAGAFTAIEDGRLLDVNQSWCEHFGYSREEAIGKDSVELGLLVGRDEQMSIRAELNRRQQIRGMNIAVRRRDGTARVMEASTEVVTINGVQSRLTFMRDITDQLDKEEALRTSEERFRLAARAVNGMVYDWNVVTGEVYRSEGLADIIGLENSDVPESRDWWSERMEPEQLAEMKEKLARVFEGTDDHYVFDYRVRHRDGHWVDVHDRAFIVRDEEGKAVRVVGSTTDVSERRRAEQALRDSEEEFRATFELASSGKAQTDPDTGLFVRVNDKFCEITGYSRDELLAMTFSDITLPEDRERTFEVTRPVREGRERSWFEEKRYLRKDGSTIWVSVNGSAITDDQGRPRRLIATIHDVSDRKRTEEALREADRRKDEFLAILAHELRNPLAPVTNSLELLRVAGDDPDVVERTLEVIDRQVTHMVRLVDELLEVSRITRGKIELRPEEVDLATILTSALETTRPLLEEHGHELSVTFPNAALTIQADPVRMTQVLANILNNAARYTPPGGSIALEARSEGDEAVIEISDNGQGIPGEMLDRIFEMFTQVDSAPSRRRGGLGIGLALARVLVEMHGGSVTARSDGPGTGSTFIIRLPLVSTSRASGASGSGTRAPVRMRVQGVRILIVDDNRDAADSLAVLLRRHGADVRVAYDGIEALQAQDEFQPACILLDIGMPGMDGYDVAREIRARTSERGSRPVIIALTGWGQEQDRARSREAGFDRHLVKPVDLTALAATLGETVGEE